LIVLLAGVGCVQRTLTVETDPPGALVVMNDQEIGRTPFTREFTWYGWYDIQLRKPGYETLSTRAKVIAPVWQWPPIDLFAELMPMHLKDQRHFMYKLTPASTQPADPDLMLARATQLRGQLQSSQYTAFPTTAPAPTTSPATAPSE
jgi:hypothetical protein